MTLDDYIDSHLGPEPEHLRRLYRATHLGRLYPRMCSDHAQGALLGMLVALAQPRHILELGTFSGYSALAMAETMPQGCILDTVEIEPEYQAEIRAALDSGGRGADINLHIGDAEALIPQLCGGPVPVDFVFIDANKRRYAAYYELLMQRLKPGAVIVADNTLWGDKILDPANRDPQTAGIAAFNDLVAADPRVTKALIPLRDGLTVLRVNPTTNPVQ